MRAAILTLLAVLALAPSAVAAEPRVSFNDIEDEVMCDTCNVPLNVAESERADQERAVIRGLIAKGMTKQQIKDELKARYGPSILATPEDRGFSLAVWWVPVAVVVGLLALVAALLPRWRRRPRAEEAQGAPQRELTATEARRLEEDLARYDV
jgi:cytochrome c-type biogenesis protein CcmH/NrfF